MVGDKQETLCTCEGSNLVKFAGTPVTFKSPFHEPCEFSNASLSLFSHLQCVPVQKSTKAEILKGYKEI